MCIDSKLVRAVAVAVIFNAYSGGYRFDKGRGILTQPFKFKEFWLEFNIKQKINFGEKERGTPFLGH